MCGVGRDRIARPNNDDQRNRKHLDHEDIKTIIAGVSNPTNANEKRGRGLVLSAHG